MLKCTRSVYKNDRVLFKIEEVNMKVNCKASKLAIIISTILFVMAILFKLLDIKYSNNFTGFMKDIFLGSFCSSIVTVFFYISAYKVERKRVLEQYWNECRRMIIGLNDIEYLNIDYDKDIFIKFINEQKNKLWITEYYKQIKQEIPTKEFENTKLIKEQISSNVFDNTIKIDSIEKKVNKIIEYLEKEQKKKK